MIQTCSMYCALILVAVRGTYLLGGSTVIFQRAWSSGRIEYPKYVEIWVKIFI